ncbi:hypothetical protein LguiA_009753 [Lonicera macranthoides]
MSCSRDLHSVQSSRVTLITLDCSQPNEGPESITFYGISYSVESNRVYKLATRLRRIDVEKLKLPPNYTLCDSRSCSTLLGQTSVSRATLPDADATQMHGERSRGSGQLPRRAKHNVFLGQLVEGCRGGCGGRGRQTLFWLLGNRVLILEWCLDLGGCGSGNRWFWCNEINFSGCS